MLPIDDSAQGLSTFICDEDCAALTVDEELDDAGEVLRDEERVTSPVEDDSHGVSHSEKEVTVIRVRQVEASFEVGEDSGGEKRRGRGRVLSVDGGALSVAVIIIGVNGRSIIVVVIVAIVDEVTVLLLWNTSGRTLSVFIRRVRITL